MDGIRQYLISVTAAAILCGILQSFLGKQGTLTAIVKLLCGLFLCLTVVSPWANLRLTELSAFPEDLSAEASAAVQAGAFAAQEALAESIKSQTEAYILDKAAQWDAKLTVEVTLTDSDPPVPCAVRLSGTVSPYAKARLSQILEEDLGIAKEDQTWTM